MGNRTIAAQGGHSHAMIPRQTRDWQVNSSADQNGGGSQRHNIANVHDSEKRKEPIITSPQTQRYANFIRFKFSRTSLRLTENEVPVGRNLWMERKTETMGRR